MPKLIGTRRPVGIPGRLLWVASIIVMMGTLPKTAGAQSSQRNDEPPLTDRERGLLERIQNLEKQLAQLRDVQVRLATIEAKLGESSTRPGAQRSTILTSQLPVDKWHPQIGDPTVADSILDRLVHNAYRIELSGDSIRKKKGRGSSEDRPGGGA